MKRLVDESTDELTRSLLVAGIEHRPPPGNRRRVMLALGAGGAFGLFSSNAFAWLSTTAGKITAASVVAGIAGAALVIAPRVQTDTAPQVQTDTAPQVQTDTAPQVQTDTAPQVQTDTAPHVQTDTPRDGRDDIASQVNAASPAAPLKPSTVERSPAPAGAAATGTAASDVGAGSTRVLDREPSPASDSVASEASGMPATDTGGQNAAESAQRAAARPSAAKSASKARARAKKAGRKSASSKQAKSEGTAAQNTSAASASGVGAGDLLVANPDLDAEVRLVDDMHRAVRRNDDEALGRYIESYRATFPDGQLKKEVAEFAARRSPSKTSESDGAASD